MSAWGDHVRVRRDRRAQLGALHFGREQDGHTYSVDDDIVRASAGVRDPELERSQRRGGAPYAERGAGEGANRLRAARLEIDGSPRRGRVRRTGDRPRRLRPRPDDHALLDRLQQKHGPGGPDLATGDGDGDPSRFIRGGVAEPERERAQRDRSHAQQRRARPGPRDTGADGGVPGRARDREPGDRVRGQVVGGEDRRGAHDLGGLRPRACTDQHHAGRHKRNHPPAHLPQFLAASLTQDRRRIEP